MASPRVYLNPVVESWLPPDPMPAVARSGFLNHPIQYPPLPAVAFSTTVGVGGVE
jgi:hypothetical protein